MFDAEERVNSESLQLSVPGVVAVQASKGMGKSKAIREAVRTQLPPDTSVLQVTFRRSLAWQSEMLGVDASLYSACAEGAISARQHPRLTIVVNSIARVRGMYDVVVIDEIVSVLDGLAGPLLSPPARVAALTTLASLIACARIVVIADAALDATCIDFILLCRTLYAANELPLRVLDYTLRLHADYAYVPHAFYNTWVRALEAAVRAGSRVVVPCMTKAEALRLAARLQPLASLGPVSVYTGDTAPDVLHAHMLNIHAAWSAAQVLIYSPVITAGCSFELAHFDSVFFYGMGGLGAVRSALQMIARVRDVRTRTVHVFIAHDSSSARARVRAPSPPLMRAPLVDSYQHGFMLLLELLTAHAAAEAAAASTDTFTAHFWSHVVHSGARIVFPARAAYIEHQLEDAELDAIAAASSAASASSVTTSAGTAATTIRTIMQSDSSGADAETPIALSKAELHSSGNSMRIIASTRWWAYDWDDVAAVTTPPSAVSLTGSLLQRAGTVSTIQSAVSFNNYFQNMTHI